MPAPKAAVKVDKVIIVLPVDLRERMQQHLFDEERGRIPKGAISDYITSLIRRDLSGKTASAVADLGDLLRGNTNDPS